MMTYKTHGVCSRAITFDVDGNKLTNVQFAGGCSGNTQGHFSKRRRRRRFHGSGLFSRMDGKA